MDDSVVELVTTIVVVEAVAFTDDEAVVASLLVGNADEFVEETVDAAGIVVTAGGVNIEEAFASAIVDVAKGDTSDTPEDAEDIVNVEVEAEDDIEVGDTEGRDERTDVAAVEDKDVKDVEVVIDTAVTSVVVDAAGVIDERGEASDDVEAVDSKDVVTGGTD